jgi:hypothetical protein
VLVTTLWHKLIPIGDYLRQNYYSRNFEKGKKFLKKFSKNFSQYKIEELRKFVLFSSILTIEENKQNGVCL